MILQITVFSVSDEERTRDGNVQRSTVWYEIESKNMISRQGYASGEEGRPKMEQGTIFGTGYANRRGGKRKKRRDRELVCTWSRREHKRIRKQKRDHTDRRNVSKQR